MYKNVILKILYKFYQFNWFTLMLFFVISDYLVTEFLKISLNFDDLVRASFLQKMSLEQFNNLIALNGKYEKISIVVFPIYFCLKFAIITTTISISTLFLSDFNIKFKDVFYIVVKCEFIFLLLPLIKTIWFYFFQTNYTLEDIQYFYPLSALNIVGYKGLDTWLLYPLQTLNLFEVAYIIYLSHQIGSLTKTNTDNGLKIVSYSYLPALLLWVTVVMFFTLNYS